MTDVSEPIAPILPVLPVNDMQADIVALQAKVSEHEVIIAQMRDALITTIPAIQNALTCIPCPEYPDEYTVGTCPECTCTLGPAVDAVPIEVTDIVPPVP